MRYQPGTRVSWHCWQSRREGIVIRQDSRAVVWVRDDVSGRVSWRHLASLTPLHYTPEAGFML